MNLNDFINVADYSAGFQDLSASFAAALSVLENLPSNTFQQTLSNLPVLPYEQLKYSIYGEDYKDIEFKKLEDIPLPTEQPHELFMGVLEKNKQITNTLTHNITCDPCQITNTLLNEVSGDCIIPNIDNYKKQIEFIELVKQLPIGDEITTEQYINNAKKIISEYIKNY